MTDSLEQQARDMMPDLELGIITLAREDPNLALRNMIYTASGMFQMLMQNSDYNRLTEASRDALDDVVFGTASAMMRLVQEEREGGA